MTRRAIAWEYLVSGHQLKQSRESVQVYCSNVGEYGSDAEEFGKAWIEN